MVKIMVKKYLLFVLIFPAYLLNTGIATAEEIKIKTHNYQVNVGQGIQIESSQTPTLIIPTNKWLPLGENKKNWFFNLPAIFNYSSQCQENYSRQQITQTNQNNYSFNYSYSSTSNQICY
jgi:hypothetical protein